MSEAAAPNRSERQACWESRDAYFSCLDSSNEDASRCKGEKAAFEKNCAASWVDYFLKRRILQKRQDAMYAQDAGNIAAKQAAASSSAATPSR